MITATDLFCGAGGSSLGAVDTGQVELVMAANHWRTAIDVHQTHFPDAGHDCADISQADPRRYPRTDILLASPECTNHSQARGVSRRQQDPELWDAPDPAAERSRATMWDVVRFAEQMHYEAIVVENVVEAAKWVLFPAWWSALESLGYTGRVLSVNSVHHTVPQSRDRMYVVWMKGKRLRPDLEQEFDAYCHDCREHAPVRQAWKNGRTVGRYRQQWVWKCTRCGTVNDGPPASPAASIIDWSLDCPRIGDRKRPLSANTRRRILAGLERYGFAPITTTGAGNTHERTPGNRARSIDEPLPVQQATATSALATGPAWLYQTAHGGRMRSVDEPHPTVCASDDRQALLMRNFGHAGSDPGRMVKPVDEPVGALTTTTTPSLLVPMRRNGRAVDPHDAPTPTVTAGGNHHALVVRQNGTTGDLGWASTPTDEPLRTLTSKAMQSLLVPYSRTGVARPVGEPTPTMTTHDRAALVDPEQIVDDCGFRMLEPYEVAAAMAFPAGYIPRDLTKRDQIKLAGNAVTPPVMAWIVGRLAQAMEAA